MRYQVTLLEILIFLAGVSVSAAVGNTPDEVRRAVVQIGAPQFSGSGICISSDGWVVTAAHVLPGWPFSESMPGPNAQRRRRLNPFQQPPHQHVSRPPQTMRVHFDNGPDYTARVLAVRDRDEKTDVAILKIDGSSGHPFVRLASRSPAVGEACFAAGWPNENWTWYEADITRIGEKQALNGKVFECLDAIETGHACAPGASGGPLLNGRYELIGVCSRGAPLPMQATIFSRWEHITACLLESGYTPMSMQQPTGPLQVLTVWTGKLCDPCIRFKDDLDKDRIRCQGIPLKLVFDVRFKDVEQEPQLAAAKKISVIPTFEINGQFLDGYRGPEDLAKNLTRFLSEPSTVPVLASVPVQLPVPAPTAPSPPPNPEPSKEETPEAQPEEKPIDVANLRFVVLVEKQDLGSWSLVKGFALSRIESSLAKKVPGLVRDKFGDTVAVNVLFERLNPARFQAAVESSGVSNAKLTLVVLVKKSFDGLKAKLADYVEAKVDEIGTIGTQGISLEFVFERTDSESYAKVIESLDLPEPLVDESLAELATAGAATGGLSGWFFRRRRKQELITQ